MDLKRALETIKGTQATAKPTVKIDKTVYLSIKEIATVLDRSIYRTRQLGWDGLLGTAHKPEKEVYYRKDAVLAYKKIQDARGIKNTDLDDSRLGKRVKFACEVITLLISQDTAITAEQKAIITTTLTGYSKQADEMIKDK